MPDQDKTVYDRISPGSVASGPEKLLPPAPLPQIPPATPPQAMPTVAPPAPVPSVQTDSTPAVPAAQPQAAAPPVQLAPAAPAPATPAPAAAPAGQSIASLIDTVSGYRIQLASVRSEEQAQATWARMQKTNADVLASLTMRAIKVDLGDRGTYYRVQAGPLDESGAASACSKLKTRSVECIVVKP